MCNWIFSCITVFFFSLIFLFNTFIALGLLFLLVLLRCIPIDAWRSQCNLLMSRVPIYWSRVNRWARTLVKKTKIEVQGTHFLSQKESYLIICNHKSWADILILQEVLTEKIPAPKFFLKRELLWLLPIASWGAWLLDFPFVARHKKTFLAKHPEQKQKDKITIKKSCERFKDQPTSIINFVEGTRFTLEKHKKQKSSYAYLLRPKAAGLSVALSVLEQQFKKFLDITIIYPANTGTLLQFISGNLSKIRVHIEQLNITPDLLGDYEHDRRFRIHFQTWLNHRWQKKDELIKKLI